MQPLLFIDSNIFLDFYRFRPSDVRVKFLTDIQNNIDNIISTSQVEMEYKKNRQTVILDTLNQMKKAKPERNVVPPIISDHENGKNLSSKIEDAIVQSRKVDAEIEKILSRPRNNDPVYKLAQKLFKSKGPYNLTRKTKERSEIRNRAFRRFMSGYPPKKKNDNSIGDAFNWEWLIHCCEHYQKDLVIVTRDTDYGELFGGHLLLNDWLREEFSDRVKGGKSIILTNRLTHGLKQLNVKTNKKQEDAEEDLISATPAGIGSEEGTNAAIEQIINEILQTYSAA